MEKKTLKRTLWIAGITFVLLLPLTVIPGLNYKVKAPWGTAVRKTSQGFDNEFVILLPNHQLGYSWKPGATENSYDLPAGYFSSPRNLHYYRYRTFVVYLYQYNVKQCIRTAGGSRASLKWHLASAS